MNLREIQKRGVLALKKTQKVCKATGTQVLARLDDFRKSSVTQASELQTNSFSAYKQLTALTLSAALVVTSGVMSYQGLYQMPMESEIAVNETTDKVIDTAAHESVIPKSNVKDVTASEVKAPAKRSTIIDDRRIIKGGQPLILSTALAEVDQYAKVSLDGYALSVDGREVGFFKTDTEASDTLKSFSAQFPVGAHVEETYFKEDVQTVQTRRLAANFNGFQTKEQALTLISKGTDVEKLHTVKDGESFWAIATQNNISVDELIKANPSLVPERIKAGDKISLLVAQPLITLCTVETVTYAEEIPYTTHYTADASAYKGTNKVTAKGANGKKEVTAKLVKENGVAVKRLVLNEKIVSKPKDQTVAQGTKKAPATAATGKLGKPYSRGSYSSGFGRRWGRLHAGVDWSMPVGSPIYAADGGVVESSGRNGDYGYCIIINHGNGIKTLYAHNSKLLVKAGQKVYKGQKIAASGNTGRSTGPHLHFEVRKNGVAVNPLKYLK